MSSPEVSSTEISSAESLQRTRRQWSRFLVLALLLHIPLFVYPVLRLGQWAELPWLVTLIVLVPFAGGQTLSRVYLRHQRERWARLLRLGADFILGISPVVLMAMMIAELLVLLDWVTPRDAVTGVIALALGAGVVGTLVASVPMIRTISFTSPRLKEPVRFVQITDVHIGSRSKAFLELVMSRINSLAPDFTCITGDFIDETGIPETDLISLRSAVGPIYFCLGNHEKYEDVEDIMARLRNLGVNVLRSDTRQFREDVQVIGIDDMEDPLQVAKELPHISLDPEAFKVLLYHRPRGLEAAAKAEIDLILSGHTHNGQIFPFNLLVGRVFDRIKGMYQIGETRQYVSQGTGTWGPVMRLGTRAEITLFEIHPE